MNRIDAGLRADIVRAGWLMTGQDLYLPPVPPPNSNGSSGQSSRKTKSNKNRLILADESLLYEATHITVRLSE